MTSELKKSSDVPKWLRQKLRSTIYISGLPDDTTIDELQEYFRTVGLIRLDEENKPSIKIYLDSNGKIKGDASLTFLLPLSVETAIDLYDESLFRSNCRIRVEKAMLKEQMITSTPQEKKDDKMKNIPNNSDNKNKIKPDHKTDNNKSKKKIKLDKTQIIAKRKHFQDQLKQLSWADITEEENKGFTIVILKHMFDLKEAKASGNTSKFYADLRDDIIQECEKIGPLQKVTVFEGNPEGPVAIRYKQPSSAAECISIMNGRYFAGQEVEAFYFDGTNYKVKESEEDESKRLDAFGDWLEKQE